MTQKFIGEIAVGNEDGKLKVCMPSGTLIPKKEEWSKHSIWEFNGRTYKPLTEKAEKSLADAIWAVKLHGFNAATKDGKRKPTSIRYAILTTGIEPFIYLKIEGKD